MESDLQISDVEVESGDTVTAICLYPSPDPEKTREFMSSMNSHKLDRTYSLLMGLRDFDPSDRDNEAIIWASGNGHPDVVRLLLNDSRVDLSAQDNEAIIWASGNITCSDLVSLLLEDPRVDPSAQDNLAIFQAFVFGHFDIVRLLLRDHRIDPLILEPYPLIKEMIM